MDSHFLGRLYTKKQLAERIGVSTRTLDRAVARGELEALSAGRSRRFSEAAVAIWLTRNSRAVARTETAAGGAK